MPHVDYSNYSGSTAYVKDDVVFFNGSSYIAKQSSTGNSPTNTTYWGLLAPEKVLMVLMALMEPMEAMADGNGFTGGSYDASTGVVTFTSNDGLGFSTEMLEEQVDQVELVEQIHLLQKLQMVRLKLIMEVIVRPL